MLKSKRKIDKKRLSVKPRRAKHLTLLEMGRSFNYEELRRALKEAIENNDDDSIVKIAAAGADLNDFSNSEPALYLAGNEAIMNKLIELGADPNSQNPTNKQTILHMAATIGNETLIKVLFENEAEPNQIDSAGMTPLHYAASRRFSKIAEFLIHNGSDPFLASFVGLSPLKLACLSGTDETVMTIHSLRPISQEQADAILLELAARKTVNPTIVSLLLRISPESVKTLQSTNPEFNAIIDAHALKLKLEETNENALKRTKIKL